MRTIGLTLVSVALCLASVNAQISARYTYPRAPSYSRASRSYGARGLYARQSTTDTCANLVETALVVDGEDYGDISELRGCSYW